MQKLNMIEAYAELAEGSDALFIHPQGQAEQARLVKMRINSPQACNLYITPVAYDHETGEVVSQDDERTIFLAHVDPGFEHIEFFYRGSFGLNVVGGSIWLDTYDNTAFSVEASDYTNYARLWEREERDPRILEIEQVARHNQRFLMEQMAADRAIYAEQLAAISEQVKNVTPAQTAPSGGTPSPEFKVSAVAPTGDTETAAPAAAGTGGESNVGA